LTVRFLTVPTGRTGSARVAGVHQDQAYTCPCRFVGEKAPQLEEGPGMPLVALCPTDRSSLSDTGEVFQSECLAGRSGFLDEGLADAMVRIAHKALFAPAVLFQAALGRLRADLLKYLAAAVVPLAGLPNQFARKGLPVAISSQVDDAQVNTQVGAIVGGHIRRFLALGDVQIIRATLPDQISAADGPGWVYQHLMLAWARHQSADHPASEGIERNTVQTHQAIRAGIVANGATRAKRRTGFLAVRLHRLDGLNGFGSGTDRELRTQAKARTGFSIDAMVGGVGVGNAFAPAYIRYPGSRFVKGVLGSGKAGLMAVYIELDADGSYERFVHKNSIPSASFSVKRKEGALPPMPEEHGYPRPKSHEVTRTK